jgi:hypothetical protein
MLTFIPLPTLKIIDVIAMNDDRAYILIFDVFDWHTYPVTQTLFRIPKNQIDLSCNRLCRFWMIPCIVLCSYLHFF